MVQDISYRLDVVVQRMYASHVRGELQAPPGPVCFRQAQVVLVIRPLSQQGPRMQTQIN